MGSTQPFVWADGVTRSATSKDVGDCTTGNGDSMQAELPGGRQVHLDVWRFMAIAVVVLDHGDGDYSYWNACFGQNWVLQFIFVICGLNFYYTRKSFAGYALRLGEYLAAGVFLNFLAFVVKGKDVVHDFWNMVFQFWFVVGLLLYSVMLAPLRAYLRWAEERYRPEPAASERSKAQEQAQQQEQFSRAAARDLEVCAFLRDVIKLLAGLVLIFVTFSLELGRLATHVFSQRLEMTLGLAGDGLRYWAGNDAHAGKLVQTMCAAAELTLSNYWLAVAVPYLFPRHQSATAWLILVNITLRRLCDWYSGAGEKVFNGLDLMLLGLVGAALGLKWRRPLGTWFARYWMLWVGTCSVIWKPGTSGRLDLLVETPWYLTWRMRFIDLIFMAVFLTAGERFVDPKIFTEDKCDFLSWLGFCLFLDHRAIHILLPQPWNWLVILAHVPIFWYIWKCRRGAFDRDPGVTGVEDSVEKVSSS